MHEYEVELQFSSGLLGQVDRTHDERDVVDGNEPMLGPDDEITSELVAIPSSNYGTETGFNTPMKSIPPHHHNSTPTHPHTSTAMPVTSSAIEQTLQSRPSNQQTISGYTRYILKRPITNDTLLACIHSHTHIFNCVNVTCVLMLFIFYSQ